MARYTRRPGSGRRTTGKKDGYTRVAGSGKRTTGRGDGYTRRPGSGKSTKPLPPGEKLSRPTGARTAATPTKATTTKAQRLAKMTPEQKKARAKRYQRRRGLV